MICINVKPRVAPLPPSKRKGSENYSSLPRSPQMRLRFCLAAGENKNFRMDIKSGKINQIWQNPKNLLLYFQKKIEYIISWLFEKLRELFLVIFNTTTVSSSHSSRKLSLSNSFTRPKVRRTYLANALSYIIYCIVNFSKFMSVVRDKIKAVTWYTMTYYITYKPVHLNHIFHYVLTVSQAMIFRCR